MDIYWGLVIENWKLFMRDFFKLKTWIITALMFILAVVLSSAIVYFEFAFNLNIRPTQASAANNVSGYAWNANTGWISFNCTNDSPACANSNYGVSIDSATGNFSGYAWSANVGWVCFGDTCQSAVYQNFKVCSNNKDIICADSGACGGQPCDSWQPALDPDGQPTAASYSFAAKNVTGWANILSLGNGGWIKFNGNKQDGQPWAPGVSIDLASGEFSGWAWNANNDGSGIGWISFNCSNERPACKDTNYKVIGVINRLPAAANLTAPNWNYIQASTNALRANLQFDFIDMDAGSYGSAYQVEIRRGDNNGLVLNTGKCAGFNTPSASCKIDNAICMKNGSSGCVNPGDCVCQYPLESELDWNTSYKWWVKVWDNYEVASALTQYDTVPDTDNDDGTVLTFTTYKHKFPIASASWFPLQPSRGEKVKFTDASQTYTIAQPTTAIACDAGKCAWLWTVPNGATIDDAASSTPTVIFNVAGANSVKLRVTDKIDGYYTEITLPVMVNAKLPKWKEVKPE